jgi:hypothetical protein
MKMILAHCNIKQLVTEQLNNYLLNAEYNFLELKSLILSKNSIGKVQSDLIIILSEYKKADQIEIQTILENQAYQNQSIEDDRQAKQDQLEDQKDIALRERISLELNQNQVKLRECETKEMHLLEELNQQPISPYNPAGNTPLVSIPINAPVTYYESPLPQLPSLTNNQIENQFNNLIHRNRLQIYKLNKEQQSIHKTLHEIDLRAEKRKQHNAIRDSRAELRKNHPNLKEEIRNTLSSVSQKRLEQNIKIEHRALEKKCVDLIQEAEDIHFSLLLEQLKNKLCTIKLPPSETEALKNILKFMTLHLQYETTYCITQKNLNTKEQNINEQRLKLEKLKSHLNLLQGQNPLLTTAKQNLLTQKRQLTTLYSTHTRLHQRLNSSTPLLWALSFLFLIPLILTLSAIIPFFIAPTLLYALVSIPPALLFLTAVGISIANRVYMFKANSDNAALKKNALSIETNSRKMGRTLNNIHLIQTTIPNLELQIQKDEHTKDQLVQSLKQHHLLAQQSLKQAQEIEPILYSNHSFLSIDPITLVPQPFLMAEETPPFTP